MSGQLESLHHKTLTATVVGFRPNPNDPTAALFPARPIPGGGTSAKWDTMEPNRTAGKVGRAGSEAQRVALRSVGVQSAECAQYFYEDNLDSETLNNLRNPGTESGKDSRVTITLSQQQLNDYLMRSQQIHRWLALTGVLTLTYLDGSTQTIDMGMPASHGGGGTPLAAAVDWDVATTDIPSEVRTWKRLISQDSGYAAATVYCSSTVMDYMLANNHVRALLGTDGVRQEGQTGRITRFLDLNWVEVDTGYLDAAGTFVPFIADDHLTIAPAPDGNWSKTLVGSFMVPTGNDNLVKTSGKVSFSSITVNPPAAQVYVGENSLPVLTVPKAVVYARIKAA